MPYAGLYVDPNHADGWRQIEVTGHAIKLTAANEPGATEWTLPVAMGARGRLDGS